MTIPWGEGNQSEISTGAVNKKDEHWRAVIFAAIFGIIFGIVGALSIVFKMKQNMHVWQTNVAEWQYTDLLHFLAFMNNMIGLVDVNQVEVERLRIEYFARGDGEIQLDEMKMCRAFDMEVFEAICNSDGMSWLQKLAVLMTFDAQDFHQMVIEDIEDIKDEDVQRSPQSNSARSPDERLLVPLLSLLPRR